MFETKMLYGVADPETFKECTDLMLERIFLGII